MAHEYGDKFSRTFFYDIVNSYNLGIIMLTHEYKVQIENKNVSYFTKVTF